MLSERGAPTPVAWTRVRAPRSLMAPAPAAPVAAAIAGSPLFATYGQAVDRQSAYEMLTARVAPTAAPGAAPVTIPDGAATGPGTPARRRSVPTGGRRWSPSPTTRTWTRHRRRLPLRSRHRAGQTGATRAGGLGEMLNNPVVTSFMKSLGTSLGGAMGRSVFGTRKRRR